MSKGTCLSATALVTLHNGLARACNPGIKAQGASGDPSTPSLEHIFFFFLTASFSRGTRGWKLTALRVPPSPPSACKLLFSVA